MVLVRGTDTICTIQKINHLLYRLERTDTKNQFSKKKYRSATAQIRVEDPAEGGGGRAQIRQREEAALGLVVAEVGKEGVGGRRSWSWSPKWGRRASVGAAHPRGHRGGEGGHRWEPLVLVVAEVGKEGAGGSHSSSWSPRWGRRASVGAARPHGRRGGEGGRRWAPLVVMVTKVGKEGICG
jgi:hypothetical protein